VVKTLVMTETANKLCVLESMTKNRHDVIRLRLSVSAIGLPIHTNYCANRVNAGGDNSTAARCTLGC